MKRLIIIFFLGTIVSGYFFPFEFTFLPTGLNTKMMLALLGGAVLGYHAAKSKQFGIPQDLFGTTVLAAIFSIVCLFSANYNETGDYTYATYVFSYFTWLIGAYAVCMLLRAYHQKVTFKLLTQYLAGVCTVQCALAILMDRNQSFKVFVDTYIAQSQDFLNDIGRLYGIGASLDTAGSRFCVVLIMIAFLIMNDEQIRIKRKNLISFLVAFLTISVIGNMIARTTTIGMIMGLAYIIYSMPIFKVTIKIGELKLWGKMLSIFFVVIVVVTYLYNNDDQTHRLMRFAFEGFFNWLETGVWTTSSTNKLTNEMWIWPEDVKSWIIGTGWFGFYIYSTDIGYCRFVLYCGLAGLSVFAFFFVYNAYIFAVRLRRYRLFFLALCVLGFIIWLKVATDLFLIYALLYFMDKEIRVKDNNLESNYNENNLLHSRNV